MKKNKKPKKSDHKIKSAIMDKVKIKRVKRAKKKTTTQEKILAGIGVGSTLLGASAPFVQKSGQTQFVRSQDEQKTTGVAGKVKSVLSRIFGSTFGANKAEAAVTQEYLDSLAANVNAAHTALDDFDKWVSDAQADAQNFGTQEERDNRLAEIDSTINNERPALVSAVQQAESAYSTAADEFIAQQNQGGGGGGGGATSHSYTITPGSGSMTVEKGLSGGMSYQLMDNGQVTFPMLGLSATADNPSIVSVQAMNGMIQVNGKEAGETDVTISYQGQTATFHVVVTAPAGGGTGGGGTVAHSYTVNTADSLSVEKDAWGGMTFSVVDENGNDVGSQGSVSVSGNGNTVDLNRDGNTIQVYGKNVGNTTVTVTYRAADGRTFEKSFSVNVVRQTGVNDSIAINATTQALSAAAGEYREFSNAFTVANGSGSYSYSLTGAPAFIGVGGNGTIFIEDTATPGSYAFTLNVVDNTTGKSGQVVLSATILAATPDAGPAPDFGTSAIARATAKAGDTNFSLSVGAQGGNGVLTYYLNPGDVLPDGLSLNSSTGEIFGNISASTEIRGYPVTVNAADSLGRVASRGVSITVNQADPAPTDPGSSSNGYKVGNLANISVTYVKATDSVQAHRTANIPGVGLVAVLSTGEIYDANGQDITAKFSGQDADNIRAAVNNSANLQNPQDLPSVQFTGPSGQNITTGSTLKAGETWKLQIKNYRAGANVVAHTVFAGQASDRNLGQTDANGNFTYTGTETENEVGSWQVEFSVDGESVAAANFNVVTAMKAVDGSDKTTNLGAGVSFTKNGASFTTLKVWEPWDISITGAKPNAQIVAQTTQVKPNGETKTSTRVLGVTDSKGVLRITDTPTSEHIGSWTIQLLADGQPMGSTASFTVVSSTLGPAPLDASGKLKSGWQSMGGNTYYNSSLGITSNGDGSVQGYTSDQYGKNLIEAGKVKAGLTNVYNQTVKEVYIYSSYDHTFQKANEGQFSTLDTANQLATIFGGKVQAAQLSADGPYRFVNIGEFPAGQIELKAENLLPSYEVVVGKYRGNAAAMARLFLNNPYDYAVAQIKAEIAAENNPSGQVNPSVTNPPKGGTQATGSGSSTGQDSTSATASTQVSFSAINSYDSSGQSSPNMLGVGYKVEIVGSNLQNYTKAYVIVGNTQLQITNFSAQNQKLIMVIPASLATSGVANGGKVSIKLVGKDASIPQGVLTKQWQYAGAASSAASSASDLNLDEEGTDVDKEETNNAASSGGSSSGGSSSSSQGNSAYSSGSGSSGASNYGAYDYSNSGSSGGSSYSDNAGQYSGSYSTAVKDNSSASEVEVENADESSSADEEVENTDTNADNGDQEAENVDTADSNSDSETEVTDSETDTTTSDQETENADEEVEDSDTDTENSDQETENTDTETTDSGDNEMESVDAEDISSEEQETENADEEAAADEEVEGTEQTSNNNQNSNSDSETEVADNEDTETEETDTDVASATGGGYSSGGGGGVRTLGGATQMAGGLQMPAGYDASGGGLQYQAPAEEETETDSEAETDSDVLGTYTVKKGDTLWKIAKKYYGDGKKWRKVLEANTNKVKNPRTMKIGIELKIPKI